MRKIKCFVKRPDSGLYSTSISDSPENLQKFVGGYIETVHIEPGLVMIVNEEGKLKGMDPNFWFFSLGGWDVIMGPAIFCGESGEDLTDIPYSFKDFKTIFATLFPEYRKGNGGGGK